MGLFKKDEAYALLVGVGCRSVDNPYMEITANDATRLREVLISRCHFNAQNIVDLLQWEASASNFILELDKLITTTAVHKAEIVVIYFSGHGCLMDGEHYFICHDTINTDVGRTAISGKRLVEKLQAIRTDKMLILMDCCHSGGIGKPVNIPFDKDTLMHSSPNRVILTASHEMQLSFLSTPVSLFTYALIEGIAGSYLKEGDKDITIFDLAMYVRERVFTLSNQKQQPQLDVLQNETTVNFPIVRYPNGDARPFFNEAFSLLNSEGKKIDVNAPLEKDESYRNQYIQFANTIYNIGNIEVFNA